MLFKTKKKLAALEKEVEELRSSSGQPQVMNMTMQELSEWMGFSSQTYSGANVTPATAMQTTAVFACVRIIAEAIAGLSIPIYRRTRDGRERADHDIWWLLNEQPARGWTAASFWERMISDMYLRGDGIAVLGRRRDGSIQEIIPIAREDVIVEKRSSDGRLGSSELRYYVSTSEGFFGFAEEDVLHFPGFGFDGVKGMSVIEWAAKQAVGIAISAEETAAGFYASGQMPKIWIEIPGALKEGQKDELRDAWQDKYNNPANKHLPMILSHGAKAHQISLKPEDAQLLQSRQWSVVDIARAFGVPPFMIGETEKSTSWGSGLEVMGTSFVRYTLRGPMQRTEQELNRKLWPRSTKFFLEFNADSLMRGDSKAEADSLRQALGGSSGPGWMTINEIRRIKNLPPVEGGDVLYTPGMPGPGGPAGQADGNGDSDEE